VRPVLEYHGRGLVEKTVVANKDDLYQLSFEATIKGPGVVVFSDDNFAAKWKLSHEGIFASTFLGRGL
jgi:hypothetical protein